MGSKLHQTTRMIFRIAYPRARHQSPEETIFSSWTHGAQSLRDTTYPRDSSPVRCANLAVFSVGISAARRLLTQGLQEDLMRATRIRAALMFIAWAACSTPAARRTQSQPVAALPPIARGTELALRDLCPLEVPSATVRAVDIEIGAALVFTTGGPYGGDVADLRRRVRHMADIHNHHRDWIAARMPERALLPPSNRHVDDVDGGARIVFEPGDPARVGELRESVRSEARRLQAGMCPVAMPQAPTTATMPETRIVRR
jgi:hypothetical protein